MEMALQRFPEKIHSPKKNNPWRGIETSNISTSLLLLLNTTPKKNNPWRGIETNLSINESRFFLMPRRRIIPGEGLKQSPPSTARQPLPGAPKKNNPWRGIETIGRLRAGRLRSGPRRRIIPGEGLKQKFPPTGLTVCLCPRRRIIPGEGLKPRRYLSPASVAGRDPEEE